MARFFPFDYFLFSALLLYVFVATLYAIIQLGVRVAFVTLYQIRKGHTSPQGLLVLSFLMIVILFSFSMEVLTLMPQYATFGSQRFVNEHGKKELCSTSALQGGAGRYCKMSTIALFYNKMAIANPVLSDVYFGLSWAFVAFSSVFALYHMVR